MGQSMRNLLWLAQQVTKIGPDQLVQAPGRAEPRWAFLLSMRKQVRQLASAWTVTVLVEIG